MKVIFNLIFNNVVIDMFIATATLIKTSLTYLLIIMLLILKCVVY